HLRLLIPSQSCDPVALLFATIALRRYVHSQKALSSYFLAARRADWPPGPGRWAVGPGRSRRGSADDAMAIGRTSLERLPGACFSGHRQRGGDRGAGGQARFTAWSDALAWRHDGHAGAGPPRTRRPAWLPPSRWRCAGRRKPRRVVPVGRLDDRPASKWK